jgi:hypothetical protein
MTATMFRRVCATVVGMFWCVGLLAQEIKGGATIDVIRARAGTLPVLEASMEPGSPKLTVVRFNNPPIVTAGERFGAFRIICPLGKPLSLAWLFSDTGNIDEYDFAPLKGGALDGGSVRHIHPPTASPDPEQEKAGRRASSLPRPWDLFELHVLGVPASLLVPGEEYLVWFRFSDRRPTDILLAATFLDPAAKLEPADLPPVFALPALGAP